MDTTQLIEQIKLGNSAVVKKLSDAYLFEGRLRGHTETIPNYKDENAAVKSIASIAACFLPEEKQAKIRAATRPPLPSNEIIDNIFTVYESVFSGKNPSRTIDSYSKSFSDTLNSFLKDTKAESIFDKKAFGVFKNAPNALMVIDAPAEGGKAYVRVKGPEKMLPIRKEVKIGESGNDGIEVLSGVELGEEVVVAEINLAELRKIQEQMTAAQQGGGLAGGAGGMRMNTRSTAGGGAGGSSGGGGRSGGGGGR